MNQEGDLVTNFVCQMLPGANVTCRDLQSGSLGIPYKNEAASPFKLDYEMLAQAAYKKYESILQNDFLNNRRRLVGLIEQYHQKLSGCPLHFKDYSCETLIKFPLACLTDSEQQELAMRTSQFVKDTVKEHHPSQNEADKIQTTTLEDLKKKEKFCWIDTVKVLKDPKW
eukprot:CAMPEP_0202470426 /NCGR_PEP_ID=MMETSP1360-20130828/81589_1 /ASSEMBLY_ACC=CAM_ASM_000848 /TAXON_ID=515479 /ORGANISM="Licmophora paradoxa, Strain CCMP2313" /LENGTH=168 /DNA_ID=CAMNT_0049096131 /DNA_START=246 /DNA_END=749 /DNA_ORIENTATION=+